MPWVVPGGAPPPPGGAESDFDEPAGGGRRWWMVVVAIFGVMALVAGMVAFFTGGGDDDPTLAEDTSTTEPSDDSSGSSTTTTEPAAEPLPEEEFLALVDELEAYVAEARGLEWQDDVSVELANDEEFERRLFEDFEEDIEDLEETEVFYRALGLLPSDMSLADQVRGIYSAGTLGVYFTEENELVVRGTSPTPYVQQTIVHELVHAIDDQNFELYRPEYQDRKDEISAGFQATVEGNASRIEDQWLSDQPEEFRERAGDEEQSYSEGIDLDGFPQILLFQIGAPYQLGEIFVDQLVADNGERGVDAALRDPPDTSEQFLFPPLYLEGEPRVEVPPPPADGEIVDDGVIGALFLYGLFTQTDSPVNQNDAVRAVQGWGGDWAVSWRDGDASCMRADFVGDTDGDTDEIENTLETWTDSRGIGEVSTTDAGRVRLESCAASGGGSPPQV
ncbi:MAG: hypothetical protein U5K30_11665 [Acidimicrobiales bacterium]|nr:hypothetical protein [Acidimicrobiales bacterium]